MEIHQAREEMDNLHLDGLVQVVVRLDLQWGKEQRVDR